MEQENRYSESELTPEEQRLEKLLSDAIGITPPAGLARHRGGSLLVRTPCHAMLFFLLGHSCTSQTATCRPLGPEESHTQDQARQPALGSLMEGDSMLPHLRSRMVT